MKNLISLGVFLLILFSVQVNAQEQSVLKIRPTGRILMDGGLFHSDNKNFVDGVAIPDARTDVQNSLHVITHVRKIVFLQICLLN